MMWLLLVAEFMVSSLCEAHHQTSLFKKTWRALQRFPTLAWAWLQAFALASPFPYTGRKAAF
jgi:hypothetical protein